MASTLLHQHLAKAPLSEILESVTTNVAQTQEQLNKQSLEIAARMAGAAPEDQIHFGTSRYSLLELGFVPEFYRLGETEISLKMTMEAYQGNDGIDIFGSLINEHNSCGIGFNPQAASCITTRLIPSSTTDVFEKRVGSMIKQLAEQAFGVIRQYVIAQDAGTMTFYELQQTGIDGLIEDNLSDYKAALIALHPDQLPNIQSLEQLVKQINAFIHILAYVSVGDTRAMTMQELYETGVQGAIDRNLTHYRNRLMYVTTLTSIEQLQLAINQSNAFAHVQSMLALRQMNGLTPDLFEQAGVTRLMAEHWQSYISALEALAYDVIDSFTYNQLQSLIDDVNA